MKETYFTAAGALALTAALAACIPETDVPLPPPPPPPTPAATRASTPPPQPAPPPSVPEPVYDNYLDAPQTPGDWEYAREPGETRAAFGPGYTETAFGTGYTDTAFILRCGDGQIALGRVTARNQAVPRAMTPRAMTVRTETLTRTIEARPVAERPEVLAAFLDPSDPLLDAMAITKGRFAIALEGERTLYLPAWVEVSRVIEDCR